MTKYAALALVACLALVPMVQAGPVGGTTCQEDAIVARSVDTYDATFYGGSAGHVVVSGDGTTDLDLFVYDEFGNLIASDTDGTDQCMVSFLPSWTGRFTIKIVNHGYIYNNYIICVG